MLPRRLGDLLDLPSSPVPFISRPIIPASSLVVVGGEEKTYKSMLAIGIGLDLAEGRNILADKWQVNGEQSVLYIEQELGDDLVRERTTKMVAIRGALCRHNFWVVSKDLRVCLDTPEGVEALTADIEHCKPSVIILDPWMFFHNKVENDNTQIKSVVQRLFGIIWPRNITAIVVHHENKPSEFRPRNKPSALRGGSALAGLADSIIMIHRPVPTRDDVIQLSFTLRKGKNPFPINLVLDDDTLSFKEFK